ncbi:MAG: hypothetical protein IJ736_00105 [Firmicutes bacterium]|nr:hypothetical protein [Bacillota bacterium]
MSRIRRIKKMRAAVIRNSLIVRTAWKISDSVKLCYDMSMTKRLVGNLKVSVSRSRVKRIKDKYINRELYFADSLCAKAVRKIFAFIAKMIRRLRVFFYMIYRGGITQSEINSLKELNIRNVLVSVSLFISAATLSYFVGEIIVSGDIQGASLAAIIGFTAALIVLTIGQNLKIVRNSLFCRLLKFIFE